MSDRPLPDEQTERFPAGSFRPPEAEEEEVEGALTVLQGPRLGTVYRLHRGENLLGRGEEAEIRVLFEGVSRLHARIVATDVAYVLSDLDSTNGTFLRGEPVQGSVELAEGDRISLGGRVILRFSREGSLERQLREELYALATRDPLTRAHNRRYLDERMDSEWPWAVRHEQSCSLLMIDLDHFKEVNDTLGHLAGDAILQEAVAVIQKTLRREDILARVGGEEFAVLCRATALDSAIQVAERLRADIEGRRFTWRDRSIAMTVSIGVAASHEPGITEPHHLRERADEKLYRAKARGRNCVEPPSTSPR
ncbi:MAG: GGDEF domain-containing protein [Polyangiaceae bacterium]|nr:GGDEF domain-containing protein [Polyangiaceae bacterium]